MRKQAGWANTLDFAGRHPTVALRGLLLGAAVLLLAACDTGINVRGNMPDPELLATIRPGFDTREDVQRTLGSPSTVSTFQDKTWYYIGQKTTQFAFYEPEVLERNVFVVNFDEGGFVTDTKLYTLEDGQEVAMVERETPTEGRELTVLQQIIGNIGRFGNTSAAP